MSAGDSPAALAELRKAVELNPQLPVANGMLGRALLRNGEHEAALRAFLRELEINPDDFDTNLQVGELKKRDQQFDDATDLHRARAADAARRRRRRASRWRASTSRPGKNEEARAAARGRGRRRAEVLGGLRACSRPVYYRLQRQGRRRSHAGARRGAERRGAGAAAGRAAAGRPQPRRRSSRRAARCVRLLALVAPDVGPGAERPCRARTSRRRCPACRRRPRRRGRASRATACRLRACAARSGPARSVPATPARPARASPRRRRTPRRRCRGRRRRRGRRPARAARPAASPARCSTNGNVPVFSSQMTPWYGFSTKSSKVSPCVSRTSMSPSLSRSTRSMPDDPQFGCGAS